jgi:putative SOS response-associated peptidase YedK
MRSVKDTTQRSHSPSQRCLFPASAFVEWQGATQGPKTTYRIGRRDGDLFAMAGLYGAWKSPAGDEIQSCVRGVCAPNALMAPIHDRMPLILLSDDEDAWLDPDLVEVEQITRYLRPYPHDLLEAVASECGASRCALGVNFIGHHTKRSSKRRPGLGGVGQ